MSHYKLQARGCAWVSVFMLSLCLSSVSFAEYSDQPIDDQVSDPLEKVNRATFGFNDGIDRFFIKPIATLYNKIMPKPLNQGITNVFFNLGTVTTIANDFLQLHWYQMLNDTWRLGINTTLGLGGLIDVGSRVGLDPYATDFGITLARWGWRKSSYMVWPLFGPSTFREGVEIPVDYYLFSVYPYIKPTGTRYGVYGLGVIDRRAQLLKFQSVFDEAAIDKYVFVRNAFMQRRNYQIKENEQLGFITKGKLGVTPVTGDNDGHSIEIDDDTGNSFEPTAALTD
ncbi:MAG: VacJ family lipoprotein [Gammaproteobacteria bacterium]|nr:VacJ family lipoprotein [Gammaproteobacteria bacterium]